MLKLYRQIHTSTLQMDTVFFEVKVRDVPPTRKAPVKATSEGSSLYGDTNHTARGRYVIRPKFTSLFIISSLEVTLTSVTTMLRECGAYGVPPYVMPVYHLSSRCMIKILTSVHSMHMIPSHVRTLFRSVIDLTTGCDVNHFSSTIRMPTSG